MRRARVVAGGALPAEIVRSGSPNGDDAADVLACPRCGGRLRLIATVEDPWEIREVLSAVALSAESVDRAPPHSTSVARPADVYA